MTRRSRVARRLLRSVFEPESVTRGGFPEWAEGMLRDWAKGRPTRSNVDVDIEAMMY
jgi:hypothetical protein